ncbi:MAG: hypothetical protein PF489_01140, partial [Salinivirgaceae bacterium]|nr:hypothetical protein [Salinivirgaceae bacterium]
SAVQSFFGMFGWVGECKLSNKFFRYFPLCTNSHPELLLPNRPTLPDRTRGCSHKYTSLALLYSYGLTDVVLQFKVCCFSGLA